MKTTTENVTAAQLSALAKEAYAAGDQKQARLAMLAVSQVSNGQRNTIAVRDCVAVIRDAEARS